MLPLILPSRLPVGIEEIDAPPEYVPQPRELNTSTVPIQKLRDGRLALDWWQRGDGSIAVKAWRKADHPSMALLPPNAPRSVRRLYTADYQLYLLRLPDGADVSRDVRQAEEAWEMFRQNDRRAA